MEEASMLFDKELRGAIEDIVVGGCPNFEDLQWRVASLSIRVARLGLYSVVEVASYAFVASRAHTWVLQDHILRDSGIYGMVSDFDIALNSLCNMLTTYDFRSFTSKDTVLHKAQHALASDLLSKIVQDMKVKFNMTTTQKAVFGYLQACHGQDFLLTIPIDGTTYVTGGVPHYSHIQPHDSIISY
ncbi:hypothetical protein L195_g005052 [Trifolium pratense]|uniref:Uncharacterized protein n=1 Tax=Trifolium pratense TaxID=57577 RepID=A0A2K3NZQ5_TRIPR|nr:hypothetical protein L195_g005052 [Trifolium pratense]